MMVARIRNKECGRHGLLRQSAARSARGPARAQKGRARPAPVPGAALGPRAGPALFPPHPDPLRPARAMRGGLDGGCPKPAGRAVRAAPLPDRGASLAPIICTSARLRGAPSTAMPCRPRAMRAGGTAPASASGRHDAPRAGRQACFRPRACLRAGAAPPAAPAGGFGRAR